MALPAQFDWSNVKVNFVKYDWIFIQGCHLYPYLFEKCLKICFACRRDSFKFSYDIKLQIEGPRFLLRFNSSTVFRITHIISNLTL